MTLGWDNPTADPTTTILLRHGDTRLSPEHRFSGLRDLPLSATGTRQAQAAACRLATGARLRRAAGRFAIGAHRPLAPARRLRRQLAVRSVPVASHVTRSGSRCREPVAVGVRITRREWRRRWQQSAEMVTDRLLEQPIGDPSEQVVNRIWWPPR